MYLDETPKLNQLLCALNSKIFKELPRVFNHFKQEGVELVMFSQYFITILAYKAKFRFAVRIMDVFLCTGEEILHVVLFNMIKLKQEKILELKNEALFRFLLETLVKDCYEEFHISTLLAD